MNVFRFNYIAVGFGLILIAAKDVEKAKDIISVLPERDGWWEYAGKVPELSSNLPGIIINHSFDE